MATTPTSCTVEFDIDYSGDNANVPTSDPTQPNWESCRSHCKTNHPSALYFKYNIPDAGVGGQYWQTCACKITKTATLASPGHVSGVVDCDGEDSVHFLGNFFDYLTTKV